MRAVFPIAWDGSLRTGKRVGDSASTYVIDLRPRLLIRVYPIPIQYLPHTRQVHTI